MGGPDGVGSADCSAGRLTARTIASKSPPVVTTSDARAVGRLDAKRVRDAFWSHGRFAGGEPQIVAVADAQPQLTVEDVEELVLAVVDVKRGESQATS